MSVPATGNSHRMHRAWRAAPRAHRASGFPICGLTPGLSAGGQRRHYNRLLALDIALSTTEALMFKHILVPTDGSDLSQKAIDGAIDLARSIGARITAYACLPQYPYSPFSDVIVEPPDEFQRRSEREAHSHLNEVQEAARLAGVACTSQTSIHPSAYLGIIEAAESGGCDVIFMASHGRKGLGSLLIGSETQRVLAHTKIPVIVYR